MRAMMAEGRSQKAKRRIKPTETVRKQAQKTKKPRRLHETVRTVARPFRAANQIGKREYYLPMPNSRLGRFLNKRRYVTPSYFRNSWQELKEVKWPNRKETTQLTIAVFLFAIVFGMIIAITDYGLDKIFRKVLL